MISDTTRYHEAGHAVASVKLTIGLEDPGIQITSDEEACTHILIPDGHSADNADYLIRRAAVKLSGPAAQLRFENRPFTEQELAKDHRTFQDLKEARMILQQYWTNRGEQNDNGLCRQLTDAGTIAHNLIATHWCEVKAIAAATRDAGCVDRERIYSIVESPKLVIEYLGLSPIR